eukprot:4989750-Pyramimonas_sp.AAC.1
MASPTPSLATLTRVAKSTSHDTSTREGRKALRAEQRRAKAERRSAREAGVLSDESAALSDET